ncbi:error-prone DNA polymerase [Thalassotalea euphylliae]|uniref:error-prone DNA polymerase n=1 Tax=Thalassotalea euphylliae TaxID=1655234 RepID=UPI003630888E
MAYAELICQSNFSFLTGASHPEELVQTAAELGYRAIAITDECSVAGVVRAYQHIKENRLPTKLIIGSLFHVELSAGYKAELTLLAPHRKAYAELCRIITNSRRRTEKGSYRIEEWDLKSVRHCLVLWRPSMHEAADQWWANWLAKHYTGRIWLAQSRMLTSGEHHYQHYCTQLNEAYHFPLVAVGCVLIHKRKRLPLQHTLTAIQQGTTVNQLGRAALSNGERCLRPLSKLAKLFDVEALAESLVIASRCHFCLSELKYEYPAELIPADKTPSQYLKELVEQGKQLRFPDGVPDDIAETIDKELHLIEKLGYEHFFITIYDIVQFAKREHILYQGRGSAANSVVCYCLEITSVDPRQISVLFERFISQERKEPPDIDVDFEHQRREEVFQYIYQKYGRKRTAITATVITYRLKSAIREVGKALGINETQLAFFIKNINRRDNKQPWYSQISELGLDIHARQGQLFIQLVNEIKGFPRHLSQHVGGFVISKGSLHELVPVENAAMEERTVIQWDKDDLDSLALLKVDILSLGMLSAIRRCFDLIKLHYQQELSIADITRMSDDPQVYRMLQQADTVGIFQIESRAQMSMLPRLKPEKYYDLVVQIAIVRPGPIQGGMVHPFLKRRSGEEAVTYPSEQVKSVLERTLGVPIFQEQVIKLAMVAAGFTGGEADQLRRAMGKWKKTGELNKFKHKLIHGMTERGYSLGYAERIFEQICGFGEYGFPESHSASFAVLAYVSAWLKYYYPQAFYCALLNSLPMGFYSASQLIQDAQRHQVKVLPVCVNQSYWQHHLTLDEHALQLGFRLVKGARQAALEQLIAKRPAQGFSDFSELQQLSLRQEQLDALASANCFKVLGGNRYAARWQLMNQVHQLPLFGQTSEPPDAFSMLNTNIDQTSLSANIEREKHVVLEPKSTYRITPTDFDNLIEDYQSTGLSLDLHPISLLRAADKLGHYTPANELIGVRHKSIVTVVGVVTGRQSPGTASGVTFVTLEDDTGNTNVVVWLATARAQKQTFLSAKVLKVVGMIEKEQNVIHVIAGRLTDLTPLLDDFDCQSRDFH